jgi:glycosyltransferase involved in cell wall biosynthesis
VPSRRLAAIFGGVEPEIFPRRKRQAGVARNDGRLTVLFYGQFIALHGIDTIIRAARLMEREPVSWILIGKGQEQDRIQRMLNEYPLPNLRWIPWVEYDELTGWLDNADLCLGIFADSQKAAQVIPNKVFQILSSGRPLLTRDSPAIRELIHPDMEGVFLVPPANPQAIVDAVRSFSKSPVPNISDGTYRRIMQQILPATIGKRLCDMIAGLSQSARERH